MDSFQFRARVYIAGPYTTPDPAENVYKTIQAASQLADMGFAPYVPHLSHLWHLIAPRTYDFWLALDAEYLKVCECMLRLPGLSMGAEQEELLAKASNVPIFYSIADLVTHYESISQK